MSVEKVKRASGAVVFRVRWREGSRNRARTFDRRRHADQWGAEVRRRAQLGTLHLLDAGGETLDEYVAGSWAAAHLSHLSPKTKRHYASLYDGHVSPFLGFLPLRSITAETIARWQTDRLAQGAGPVAVRQALTLLGAILQRAVEGERIVSNPARLVRKAPSPHRAETRPLAPETIEAMRRYFLAGGSENAQRDATLLSVLAYAGLRPGEALALRWGDVSRAHRARPACLSLGEEADTKTRQHRTVRLLTPLRADLAAWKRGGRKHQRAVSRSTARESRGRWATTHGSRSIATGT